MSWNPTKAQRETADLIARRLHLTAWPIEEEDARDVFAFGVRHPDRLLAVPVSPDGRPRVPYFAGRVYDVINECERLAALDDDETEEIPPWARDFEGEDGR